MSNTYTAPAIAVKGKVIELHGNRLPVNLATQSTSRSVSLPLPGDVGFQL